MLRFIKGFWYSFPVQLLALHLKRHQILLLMWVLLVAIATNNFGKLYGIPYLFLDPEYLGKVDYLSYALVGAAFGGFLTTWNITTYILESSRFQFLATFERPFAVYSLNNSVIPIAFIITYIVSSVQFQTSSEFTQSKDILLDIAGFLGGMAIMLFISAIYFQTTNKNIFNIFNVKIKEMKRIRRRVIMREDKRWDELRGIDQEYRVDTFVTMSLGVRHVRSVVHYEEKMLREVFRQNHMNAFFIEVALLMTIFGLGFLIDYQVFRLPAAVSVLLFFAAMISVSGMLDFWFKTWKTIVLVGGIILINMAMLKFDLLTHQNKAFGLDYNVPPASYSYTTLDTIANPINIQRDRLNTLAILEAWKAKTGEKKPRMVFMNFSGGGLSSATFSTTMVQRVDSATGGDLLKHTVLMTGASGGMIGAAYLRELYLQQLEGKIESMYNPDYPMMLSEDMLNATLFTLVTNDLLYPLQTFEAGGQTYRKDRGYMLEKIMNENVDGMLEKTLADYDDLEKSAVIPMMVFAPTIVNDQRRMFISSQPVSYLMRPTGKNYRPQHTDVDGIDFMTFFRDQGAENLRISSAVRMNATYPYILPYVTMPTDPMTKVMDAGFRDNYGLTTTSRFIYTFKDWIKANTSGVLIVQIRQYPKEREITDYKNETLLTGILSPITSVYGNLSAVQDYDQAYEIGAVSDVLDGKVELITFEYTPDKKEEETSLSFHLTTKERLDIINTVNKPYVHQGIERIKELLDKKKR